ncbi:MAG: S46 family peptidase, partial [Bacteroidota bacterium]
RNATPEAAPLIVQMEDVQAAKTALAPGYRAFRYIFNARYGSGLLQRALAVNAGEDPAEVSLGATEEAYLTAELAALQTYYVETGKLMPKNLQGEPADNARFLLENSTLAGDSPEASGDDAALLLVQEVLPEVQAFYGEFRALQQQEADLAAQLGRTRYEAFGNSVPPDATFSLRFTDGIVTGYPYNGTQAPAMTTLFGLFDHHYSYCVAGEGSVSATECDWLLPQQWLDAQNRLDLSTPVNFTSTSDTIGGNSGSPVVNRDLQLVGLNFDRTIEGLVRDYLYAPERGRNVMVDTRVVLEALREVYGLPALADELTGE